jgi:hypothetical protein
MANTMKALQTVTVGSGGAASISFTSIPSTYTDLVVKFSARDNFAGAVYDNLLVYFNGNTTGYTSRNLYGNGSAAASASGSFYLLQYVNANVSTSNTFGNGEVYIPNYAGSNNKSASIDTVTENNATEAFASMSALLWSNTAAVTSVTLAPSSGTLFLQYTTATLYGVFNQDVIAAPAAPTIGTATASNASASITFTGVANAASYTMTSTPGSLTATGTTSPLVVSGLTNGIAYTFKVKANNPFGSSAESAASNSATPVAPTYDVIVGINNSPYVAAWTFSGGFGTKYTAPASLLDTTANAVSFAGNKSAVLAGVNTTPNAIGAYAWSSGWGTRYAYPSSLPSGRQLGATFWPKSASVATGGDGSHLNAYAWSSGFGSKYANPSPVPTGGFAVRWSNSGAQIAVSNNSASTYQTVYFFSSGFGSKYADPATTPGGATYGTAWTPNDNAILWTSGTSPYVYAYPWSSGYGTKYSNPASAMSGLPGRVSNFNYAGSAWVGSGNSTDIINAYAWSSGFGTKYSAPAGLPVSRGENAYFTPDDAAVIWSGQSNGTESNLLAWAWTNGSGFGTKYSDPPSLSTSIAYGLDVR